MSSRRTLSDLLRETHVAPALIDRLAATVFNGVRYPSVFSNTFIGPLPASAVETVVLTTPPLTLPLDGAVVFLVWSGAILTGTTTSSISHRVRRGTTTAGTQVSTNPFQTSGLAAGQTFAFGGVYFDQPGAVAGQQYSLTVNQGSATGAGTWQDGALLAFAL